jgi:N-acetylglucosamine-6-sulfatase
MSDGPKSAIRGSRRARRLALSAGLAAIAGVAALVLVIGSIEGRTPATVGQERPNMIFILTDDQRLETIEVMPQTNEAFGLDFRQFVAAAPSCCPSRSSFLTGKWVHGTGVYTTSRSGYEAFKRLEPNSLGPWLQERGYVTGFIGKYFNFFSERDSVPPGWDEFYGRVYGPGTGNGATSFTLREFRKAGASVVRNEIVGYPNEASPDAYATRVFGAKAKEFVRRAVDPAQNPERKPFALFLWTTSVNVDRVEARYADAPLPPWDKPPSFLERDMRDKPSVIRARADVNAAAHEAVRAKELRQSMTIDDVIGDLVGLIDQLGLREETWGVFASDNGRMWGEHRLAGKWVAYEESVRVPFRVMLPTREAFSVDALVANVDVAPTIMALAGDSVSRGYEGRSLLPLVKSPAFPWRRNVLLELSNWCGFRSDRWKYVQHSNGEEELYDLRRDPYELRNQAAVRQDTIDAYRGRIRRSQCHPPGFRPWRECTLRGSRRADRLHGTGLPDYVCADAGSDRIRVVGGGRDIVNCGSGSDGVAADQLDTVQPSCESVRRAMR